MDNRIIASVVIEITVNNTIKKNSLNLWLFCSSNEKWITKEIAVCVRY